VVLAGSIPSRADIMLKSIEMRNSLMLLEEKIWNVRLKKEAGGRVPEALGLYCGF